MTAAEKAVKAAEQALAQAEAQLASLNEEIERQKAAAAEVEASITGQHEAGETVSPSDRKRRREALAECEDLQRERATVEALIERRREELRTTHVDLAAARAAEYQDEAAALGGEIWDALAMLVDLWERMEAVESAARRESSTVQRAGRGGLAGALQVAGLENRKVAIRDLVSAVRPELAKRQVPA